jgi:predicted nucleic-acid-binding protein
MNSCFVDTNILLRHLLQDHSDHSPRASRLIAHIADQALVAYISETVIFEVVFTMTSTYSVPRSLSRELITALLGMPNLVLATKEDMVEALRLWVEESPLSFADCYHLVRTKSLGLTEIYSFDKKLGRYPGVTRVEP